MNAWDKIQEIALKVDPTLTGDQLDRIANLTYKSNIEDVYAVAIVHAIRRVKTRMMEK